MCFVGTIALFSLWTKSFQAPVSNKGGKKGQEEEKQAKQEKRAPSQPNPTTARPPKPCAKRGEGGKKPPQEEGKKEGTRRGERPAPPRRPYRRPKAGTQPTEQSSEIFSNLVVECRSTFPPFPRHASKTTYIKTIKR